MHACTGLDVITSCGANYLPVSHLTERTVIAKLISLRYYLLWGKTNKISQLQEHAETAIDTRHITVIVLKLYNR